MPPPDGVSYSWLAFVNDMCPLERFRVPGSEFFLSVRPVRQPKPISRASGNGFNPAISKREIILEMGTQQKWFYLLKQGVACSYSLQSDGSEITDCIMAEPGMPVMPSPEFDIPSPTYIEALTDCTLVLLKISDVQNKAQYNPGLATLINRYLSRAWHDHYKTESALRLLPARDRYKWFLEEYPGVIDRVPHSRISSFLGMSPITLSRVRANI